MYYCLKEKWLSGTIKLLEWKWLFCSFFNLLYHLNSFWKGGLLQCSKRAPWPVSNRAAGYTTQPPEFHVDIVARLLVGPATSRVAASVHRPSSSRGPWVSLQKKEHTELRCVQAQVQVHMTACVNVFTPVFDSRLLFFASVFTVQSRPLWTLKHETDHKWNLSQEEILKGCRLKMGRDQSCQLWCLKQEIHDFMLDLTSLPCTVFLGRGCTHRQKQWRKVTH